MHDVQLGFDDRGSTSSTLGAADPLGAPRSGALVVGALLFTLVLGWPVLRAPGERLFGNELIGRVHDPFTVISIFEHPGRPTIYTQPATDYLGALLAHFVGGVAAYNLVVLASLPLAALFAYLLAFRLTRSTVAATLAAALYAFSPFHLAHAAYHPHVAQTQWLPLFLLALLRAIDRPAPRRLALLALSFGLVALSNFYFGYIAAVLTPVVVLLHRPEDAAPRAPGRWRSLLPIAGTFVLFGAGAALYLHRIAPRFLADPAARGFPSRDLDLYTARWQGYLVPPADHPWLGTWARAFWSTHGVRSGLVEQQVTLGFGVLGLAAAAALFAWWRRRAHELGDEPRRGAVPLLAALAAVAFVCSLPPTWHLAGFAIPAPSRALFAVAPMFRALARFAIVVDLAVAILAGTGFAALWRTRALWPRIAAATLLALALVERSPLPPWRWRDVLPTMGHRWLAQHPSAGRVLDCAPASDPAQRSVPRLFGPRLALLGEGADCGESDLPAKLAARGVDRLIVRRPGRLADWLATRPAPSGLSRLRQFDDSIVYAVTASGSEASLEVGDGFYVREYRTQGSFRWMGARGTLHLVSTAGRPLRVRLALELHAFDEPRTVRVESGDGRPLATLEVGLAPRMADVGELELGPRSRLEVKLASEPGAVTADERLHNGDPRAVSVALWNWRVSPVGEASSGR